MPRKFVRRVLEVGVYRAGHLFNAPIQVVVTAARLRELAQVKNLPLPVMCEMMGDEAIGWVSTVEVRHDALQVEFDVPRFRPPRGYVATIGMVIPSLEARDGEGGAWRLDSVRLSPHPIFPDHIAPEERAARLREDWTQ